MTPFARAAGRAIGGSALACCALLVTACGTSPPSASSSSPPSAPGGTAPATPVASPSTSGSAAASAPATPPPAGVAPCPTRSLAVKAGLSQGTAGSIDQVLDFTNISDVSCTLYGYPGVSFASTGASGGQIGAAAKENPSPPRKLITLAPRAVANALLQIAEAGNYPATTCQPVTAHSLVIYPPNQTTPIYLAYKSAACVKPVPILTVSVVQPGSGGSA